MVLQSNVLTFTANTSIGNQDCTGTTYTPKVAIIWGSGVPNAADTFNNGYTFHYGFTDGSNSRCFNMISEDARADSDSACIWRNDSVIVLISETDTAATRARATFVSFLSNGIRINWATAPATAFKFHIQFLGGDDITNTKVGDFTILDDAPGTKSATGFGFQPDLVIMPQVDTESDDAPTVNTIQPHAMFTLAMAAANAAASSIDQHYIHFYAEDGLAASDTFQLQDDIAGVVWISAPVSINDAAPITVFNSDGFNFTWTGGSSSLTLRFPYLAIKGGSYSVGQITEPGGTGNQTVTPSKDVKAVQLIGIGTATNTGVGVAQAKLSVGAGISSSQRVTAYVGDLDAANTTATVSRYEETAIYTMCTPAATATSSTIDEECDLVSVSSTGFVINWTNVGGALILKYITFGSAAGAAAGAAPHSFGKIHTMFDNNAGPAIFG